LAVSVKAECLHITVAGKGPFESKVLIHHSCIGPLWKQVFTLYNYCWGPLKARYLYITVTIGAPFKADL